MSVALWCVLIAALLPILTTGLAKAIGSKGDVGQFDNAKPREWQSNLVGLAGRAHAAHLNAFEAFPLFAVAVLVAESKNLGSSNIVTTLAILFVTARLAFLAAYLLDRPTLRSLAWAIAFFAALGIFLTPAFA